MSHTTIHHPPKNWLTRLDKKTSADFVTDFIFYFLVSLFVSIGENPPIWVSHSPTIIEFKNLFFVSFKDLTLM